MTNSELAEKLNTPENRAAYQAATDKLWFVQDLIEGQDIAVYPGSPLVAYIEDILDAPQ